MSRDETTTPITEEMLREDIESVRRMGPAKSNWSGEMIKVSDLEDGCYIFRSVHNTVCIARGDHLKHEKIGPIVYGVSLDTIVEAEKMPKIEFVYEPKPQPDYLTGVRSMLNKRRKK